MIIDRFRLTTLAVLFAVILGLGLQHLLSRQSDTLRLNTTQAHRALAAIRKVDAQSNRLQFTSEPLNRLALDWQKSREEATRSLQALQAAYRRIDFGEDHVERAIGTWNELEAKNVLMDAMLAKVQHTPVDREVQLCGMVLALQRLLATPDADQTQVATLGLTLRQLDDLDRRLQEVETELTRLSALTEEATPVILQRQIAMIWILGATLIVTLSLLLLRIARLHHRTTQENTARLSAEQNARANAEDLRITLDSIGDAVITTDTHGQVRRLNPVASQLTGWTLQDAVGQPLEAIFVIRNEKTGHPIDNPVKQVLHSGKTADLANHTVLVHRDGSVRQITDSAAPIRDQAGHISGVVLVFRDVTEQQRVQQQLQESQKMESIGQLAGGIAHDFNNLLQVISGNLSLATDPVSTPDETKDSLREIARTVSRAADLTRQLLAFGRRQTFKKSSFDPVQLIEGSLKMVRRLIGEHIELRLNLAPALHWLYADQHQIEQVLLNLCINARDAMVNGGRLTLTARNIQFSETELIAHPWARAGNFLEIALSDTGTGMDAATQRRIFDPFFTTKEVGKGTGLGLAVVNGIIQQHEGFIHVYSELGLGTTFRLFLPASPPPTTSAAPASEPALPVPASPPHQHTLLLAEDDESVRNMAATVLRRQGYQLIVATDGQAAVELAAQSSTPISLAILDMVMPRLGGGEAAQRLQAATPGLPILICTGYAGDTLAGLEPFPENWHLLRKPYSVAQLIATVDACLRPASSPQASLPP